MGEVGVDGAAQDFAAEVFELLVGLVEGYDLGGAHEGEVEGVPEEEDVFVLELFSELYGLYLSVVPAVRGEVGGWFSDQVQGWARVLLHGLCFVLFIIAKYLDVTKF